MNTYLMPVMNRYIEQLEDKLKGAEIRIIQSNEGYITLPGVKEEPVKTVLSGPACYSQGEMVTVTDANVVLGRPIPEFFLGGRMKIVPERSRSLGELKADGFGSTEVTVFPSIDLRY
jgi:N-methylhydantoinase A/oxoprolinase/acetone carboxylase beta subunit